MYNFNVLEIRVLSKIEDYCSGIRKVEYPFVEVINDVLTAEDVKEVQKHFDILHWNYACSLTILIKILHIKEYDVVKYNEILEMTSSELFNKISEGIKRLKIERKIDKIQEDF